jgi:sulfatase maturation enzyme AslB (radical SAM superfamily)
MDLDLFKKIVDQMTDQTACLASHGEVMLDPTFVEKLRYLGEKGIRCDFTTNGTIFKDEFFQALQDYPRELHRVVVSLDGLYADTREAKRHLGKLIDYPIDFINRLIGMKNSGLLPDDFDVTVSLMRSDQDYAEIEHFIRHWLMAGADMVLIRTKLDATPQKEATYKSGCRYRTQIVSVDANGMMRLCDRYMPGSNTFIADMRTEPLLETFAKIPEQAVCKTCSQAYTGSGIHGEVFFKNNGFKCFYSKDYYHEIYSKKDKRSGLSWGIRE